MNEENEMIEYIEKCADKDGLPLFNEEQWQHVKQTRHKDPFRKAMVKYIVDKQPPFPYKPIQENEVIDKFFELIIDSYLYVLRSKEVTWREEWENMCNKELFVNQMSKDELNKVKNLYDTKSKKDQDLCRSIIKNKLK